MEVDFGKKEASVEQIVQPKGGGEVRDHKSGVWSKSEHYGFSPSNHF